MTYSHCNKERIPESELWLPSTLMSAMTYHVIQAFVCLLMRKNQPKINKLMGDTWAVRLIAVSSI